MDKKLDWSLVKKVYSGKPGCCCGCRGIYRPVDSRLGKKLQKLFLENLDAVKMNGDDHAYIETEKKLFIAYFSE